MIFGTINVQAFDVLKIIVTITYGLCLISYQHNSGVECGLNQVPKGMCILNIEQIE